VKISQSLLRSRFGDECSTRTPAKALLLPGLLALGFCATGATAPLTGYDLVVSLDPPASQLAVDAVVVLPEDQAGRTVEFLLTSKLKISSADPPVTAVPNAGAKGFQGINGSSIDLARQEGISRYSVTLPAGTVTLKLTYRGPVDFPLAIQGEEYTRGFQETPGIISEDGVYLGGSTLWYPYFSDDLVTFTLNARVPAGWHLISQGDGSSQGPEKLASWDSAGPVDEIYMVGGPLTRYQQSAGAAVAEVYLREQDEPLAAKYLTATARYIEMYGQLIGPYPYSKFALVENFWETGYGMPSFTLLGPQIIRFPFILTSSYPHEILHNWWGNSVFVDYPSGNWAEGLTAYMADHLMKEQQGQGAEYRRDTLKKYRDFVKDDRDFPLSEFRSRHSAATEAVGYGKTMMGFHMLRLRVGDDAFRSALANFYRKQRGHKASFDDVQADFQTLADDDLDRFFREWVTMTGAADLALEDVAVRRGGNGYIVSGSLRQRQRVGSFELDIPVAVTTTNGAIVQSVRIADASTQFELSTRHPPVLLNIDPEFDVFRLLDARETAPSIGQLFGEPAVLAVLPAAAGEATRSAYEALVKSWESPVQSVEIVLDTEVDELPPDRAAWLFGRDNQLARDLLTDDALAAVSIGNDSITVDGQRVAFANHSSVIITRHPANVTKAVGWITADPAEAFEGVARKLPHYGKYSYLVFEGTEPANIIKGEWTATDSPLFVDLREAAGQPANLVPQGSLPARAALAELPPVFSAERLRAHVKYLAAPEMEGRGLGSAALENAAEYIAAQFREAGLEPGGDERTYFQAFTAETGPDGGPHEIRNVIGYLPGTDPRFDGQAALITAHYDHLGFGWPDERAQAEPGAIYAGADDNASGVAVLIELARSYAEGSRPPRALVFVALTGEEAGLLGSQHYVQQPMPLTGITAVINMDTVGRLGDQPVQVLATESATEWPHIFRGVGFTTGIETRNIPGASASSDQQSFIDAGIPGVQIFTGAHLDYHRPSDTVDKVDVDGMVKVATVVKEAATYLTERVEPLTVTGAGRGARTAEVTQQSAAGNRRRVSFGTVPDFAHQGPGVKVDSVVPDSPAEAAGIRAGDVVTAIDGQEIDGLAEFSEMLKQYDPGDTVKASGIRDGNNYEVDMELVAR
jgi:hypothetical protein